MRRGRLLLAATFVLLAILVWRTRIWEAGPLLAATDPGLLGAALALNVVLIAVWGLRSRILLRAAGHRLGWVDLSLIGTFANLANSVTPASTGEALRALILRDRHGIELTTGVAIILIERFYALALIVVAAVAATAIALSDLTVDQAGLVCLTAVMLGVLPGVLYRTPFRAGGILRKLGLLDGRWPARLRLIAVGLIDAEETMAGLLRRPGVVAGFLGTTLLALAVPAAQLWLVLLALGAPISFAAAWASTGTGMLAGILSALPFGLGATDVVGAAILIAVGVDATVAGTAFLLLRVVNTVPIGLAGGLASLVLARRPRP